MADGSSPSSGSGGRDTNSLDRDIGKGPTSSASASAASASTVTGTSTGIAPHPASAAAAPPGFGLKRAATVAEVSQLRRRPTMAGAGGAFGAEPGGAARDGRRNSRRRGSNISEFSSFDFHNAHPLDDAIPQRPAQPQASNWQSIPLAFALLPALGGLMFKDGSALVTDFLLLGLAAVFLQWSITQPWNWYFSAQEIRVSEETAVEVAVDDAIEDREQDASEDGEHNEDEAPSKKGKTASKKSATRASAQKPPGPQHKALRELYVHEVLALLSCFVFPVVGASILHAIRTQLSRPSEGLVSNYNLTVFLLAAEIRPVKHLMQLLEARTLHLQRIVLANPFGSAAEPKATISELAELAARVEQLEVRATMTEDLATAAATAAGAPPPQSGTPNGTGAGGPGPALADAEAAQTRRKDAILREARSQMQPEVDALNRAVRRYEKKQTILAVQLDSRLQMIDNRLDDALSLAAHAAKNSRPRPSFWSWLLDQVVATCMVPLRGIWLVVTLPYRTLLAALGRGQGQADKTSRGYRNGRSSRSSSAGAGDRFPARLSRR